RRGRSGRSDLISAARRSAKLVQLFGHGAGGQTGDRIYPIATPLGDAFESTLSFCARLSFVRLTIAVKLGVRMVVVMTEAATCGVAIAAIGPSAGWTRA